MFGGLAGRRSYVSMKQEKKDAGGGRIFEWKKEVKSRGRIRRVGSKVLVAFHSSGRANWVRMRK